MIRSFLIAACVMYAHASNADVMRMAVTTSFENSGLSDVLLPALLEDTGIDLQLLVVGTGQALRLGETGDVDAVLVHSRAAEDAFIAAGHGTHRREIMYNDFVVVGPRSDVAGITNAPDAAAAFALIAAASVPFVSRGDDSGTHVAEQRVWASAELSPDDFDTWYRAVGAGMGAALNTASGMNAYVFSDRASWLNFSNKDELSLLFSGDPALHNQYALLPVNPSKHDRIRNDLAQALEAWLTSPRAENLIDTYTINGENLFFFNAVTE